MIKEWVFWGSGVDGPLADVALDPLCFPADFEFVPGFAVHYPHYALQVERVLDFEDPVEQRPGIITARVYVRVGLDEKPGSFQKSRP